MRFLVAGGVAAVATCITLRLDHRRSPLGDHRQKALGLWILIVLADVALALGAVWLASETGSGSAGDVVGWVLIGIVAPLGLRSPVFKDKQMYGRQVDIGFTYVYDLVRTYLTVQLDRRMAALRLRDRAKRGRRIADLGWTYGTLLVFVEAYLEQLTVQGEDEAAVLTKAYLPRGFSDDGEALAGLIKVVLNFGSGMVDSVCARGPTKEEQLAAPAAEDRARIRVRQEEEGPTPPAQEA